MEDSKILEKSKDASEVLAFHFAEEILDIKKSIQEINSKYNIEMIEKKPIVKNKTAIVSPERRQ